MTAEILEDIIEAFPGFITDEDVNGGDLVEFIGDMITRYEANRPRPRLSGVSIKITVTPTTTQLHDYDEKVAGTYLYPGNDTEAALDIFHSTVPIKVLDDFDIAAEVIHL
jgi:hypothetical protein